MRYLMKQKWLSWTDTFNVDDEQGNLVCTIKGAMFSWGNQLTVSDAAGNEVAQIKQVILSLGHNYEIYRGGTLVARVHKKWFTLFKARFTIDVPGPDDLEAAGDFLDHEYTFSRHGAVVASVSKKWFSWTDSYGIDVADGVDPLLIIATAVVIDCVSDDNRKRD